MSSSDEQVKVSERQTGFSISMPRMADLDRREAELKKELAVIRDLRKLVNKHAETPKAGVIRPG